MFSLKKLLGKEDKFFDLLEASAEEARASTALLGRFLQERAIGRPTNIDDFIHTRRKDKRITQQITEELCKTFVTPLEREDIEALAFALYRIPKMVKRSSNGSRSIPAASRKPGSCARLSSCSSRPTMSPSWSASCARARRWTG
jgi:hypothetical protein